jgi:hypothetical protein
MTFFFVKLEKRETFELSIHLSFFLKKELINLPQTHLARSAALQKRFKNHNPNSQQWLDFFLPLLQYSSHGTLHITCAPESFVFVLPVIWSMHAQY